MQLTQAEKNQIAEELSNRIKNLMYMNAREAVDRCLDRLGGLENIMDYREGRVDVRYNVEFIVNDLIEILGGIRRE